ncbi:hypothetical protein ABG067_003092 [Albugo candida]
MMAEGVRMNEKDMIQLDRLKVEVWPHARIASNTDGNFDDRGVFMVEFEAVNTKDCVSCIVHKQELHKIIFSQGWETAGHTKGYESMDLPGARVPFWNEISGYAAQGLPDNFFTNLNEVSEQATLMFSLFNVLASHLKIHTLFFLRSGHIL